MASELDMLLYSSKNKIDQIETGKGVRILWVKGLSRLIFLDPIHLGKPVQWEPRCRTKYKSQVKTFEFQKTFPGSWNLLWDKTRLKVPRKTPILKIRSLSSDYLKPEWGTLRGLTPVRGSRSLEKNLEDRLNRQEALSSTHGGQFQNPPFFNFPTTKPDWGITSSEIPPGATTVSNFWIECSSTSALFVLIDSQKAVEDSWRHINSLGKSPEFTKLDQYDTLVKT